MRSTLFTTILAGMILVSGGCDVITQSSIISGGVAVSELRCEYRVNPLGIDVIKPRLSWIMESHIRFWWPIVRKSSDVIKASFGTAAKSNLSRAIRLYIKASL
jgi:hypothetical protein